MITVTVKLYGTLPWRVQDYDPEKGVTLKLGQGACVSDLTAALAMSAEEGVVVAMAGRVARPEDLIEDMALIRIFPVAHGG